MSQDWFGPSEGVILRIATFRVRPENISVVTPLRRLANLGIGRALWVGRRLIDDPGGAEVCVVSVWGSASEMERGLEVGRDRVGAETMAALEVAHTELYTCRAHGRWQRPDGPWLLRIFRGRLVTGDAGAFDSSAAAEYLGHFERNPRCVSMIAANGEDGTVVLASLWTNWDAVVSATGGDLRSVLPIQLPPWAVDGSAVHYEVVAASA